LVRTRTGCPRRDLSERYGNWKTVDGRQRRGPGGAGPVAGGLSTKIHLLADRRCRPLTQILTPGQQGSVDIASIRICPRDPFHDLKDTT
jgi:transposase